MTTPRRRLIAVVCAATVSLGLGACSPPDLNPPVKVTGDPSQANPSLAPTTIEVTTTTTPPELFYPGD